MLRITRVLTDEEFQDLQEKSIAQGTYRFGLIEPGMAWYTPWVYDPSGKREAEGKHVMCKKGDPFLSIYYWRDWADKRPPICIAGPNNEHWEIDRKSSNGEGWQVTGELPNITCTPSIVLHGYHGYLRNGEFTPDLEGRN